MTISNGNGNGNWGGLFVLFKASCLYFPKLCSNKICFNYLINQKSNSGLAESCSVVGSGVVVGGGVVVRQLRGDNSVSLWEMLSVKH